MPPLKGPNNRIFPRRKLDLGFVLDLAGKKVNAKLIDLSIDGFGIFVHDTAGLYGSLVEIRVDAIDIQARGEIVWSRNYDAGTRLGISRTGPLTGDMRNFRPADLLLGIQKRGKTGVLRLVTPLSSKYVYFSNGRVVFATSDNEDKDVCDALLYAGKVGREEFVRSAGFMRKAGKRQVAVLLELGYIKPEDVVPVVQSQAEMILMSLVTSEEGGFIFRERPVAPEKVLSYTFNLTDLIYRGAKTFGDPERISDICKGREAIVCLNSGGAASVKKIRLDDLEKGVIQFLDRERTIQEVLSVSPMDAPETLRMIYALHNVQALEIIEAGSDSKGPDGEQERVMSDRELEAVQKIEKLFSEYRSLGYHGVMNVGHGAPPEDIKRAYYRMAREFHPDRHLHVSSSEVMEKLNVIFSYINEAYQALIASQHNRQEMRGVRTGQGDLSYKQMARQKFETGMNLLLSGEYEQAVTFFGQATNLDASTPAYHYHYSTSLFRNNRMREAEGALRKASQLDPQNAVYIAELGHIYLALGFHTRAKKTFEKALRYDPANQRASEGMKKCSP